MGYELRRELRTALGPKITGLQRAVALEIADDARGEGRTSHASLDDLVEWTGAKDVNVVRNALKRLADAGWEFRVPIGTGKDGRTLYAVPGKRMTFRVPDFQGGAVAPSQGAVATPSTEDPGTEGVAGARSEGATAPSQGATAPSEGAGATPSSHTTTPTSPTPASAAARSKKKRSSSEKKPNPHQVADDLTAAFWERHGKGRAQSFIAVRGVIRTAIGNGVERDDCARALDHVAREGRSISGATIDIALGKIRGQQRSGPFQNPENHDEYDEGLI
ncbi:hypothetical protein ACFXAZ_12080 [Streptomyces sp. NPDC059477]|uniref:hypothetical protein n=1 Tax=Streptomyces sp. NPDC059477 TaxID=3346847 RepID=UPI0036B8D647